MSVDLGCQFRVRAETDTPADIHPCGRPPSDHPVTGMGRFENHRNYLAPLRLLEALLAEGRRAKWAAQFEDMGDDECETCRRARWRAAFHKPRSVERRHERLELQS